YLVICDGHDVVYLAEQVLQGQRANLLDPERVGDGPLGILRQPGHPPAAAERVTRIGRQLGLGPDDPRPRAQRADGGGEPGDEAAAPARGHPPGRLRGGHGAQPWTGGALVAGYAPGGLNEPVGCSDSAFSSSRGSAPGNGTSGVRNATPSSRAAAARISSTDTSGDTGPPYGRRPAHGRPG